jgi:Leucine-rich repeat (LRR) protein
MIKDKNKLIIILILITFTSLINGCSKKTRDTNLESKINQIQSSQNSNEVEIETYGIFEDKYFASTMSTILKKPINNITKKDMEELTCLIIDSTASAGVDSRDISNLAGIENCINLKELTINYTKVSDISCIKILKKLTKLELSANNISDISVLENLKELQYLKIYEKELSNINSIAHLKKLKELSITFVGIADIDSLSNLLRLNTLHLSGNNIRDITPLSNLSNLKELSLNDNMIIDITPLLSLKKLQALYLNNNKIENISPLEDLTNLKSLYLDGNQITNFSPVSRYYPELDDKDFDINNNVTYEDINDDSNNNLSTNRFTGVDDWDGNDWEVLSHDDKFAFVAASMYTSGYSKNEVILNNTDLLIELMDKYYSENPKSVNAHELLLKIAASLLLS